MVAAGLAAAGAGTAGYVSLDARSEFARASDVPAGQLADGARLASLQSQVKARATAANVLWGVAGSLAVVGVVEALFVDWHGDRAALIEPLAVPGGAGAAVSGRF